MLQLHLPNIYLTLSHLGGDLVKNNSGFTLLELIVSVAVLAVVSTALFAMFTAGLRQSVQNHLFTMASIEAQMQMEQLIGRMWVNDLEHEDWNTLNPSNDFHVRLEYEVSQSLANGTPVLIEVTVTVYRDTTPPVSITSHRNMLIVNNQII